MRFSTMVTCVAMSFAFSLLATRSDAAVLSADTTGSDNFSDASFYGIQFVSGPGAVQSITYDITADTDAFFDFDGSASYANTTLPQLATLIGLVSSDVSFTLLSPFTGGNLSHPARLRLEFAPGSFQAGDSLRFATDTDFYVSDPAPGSVFGTAAGLMTITLYGGNSNSANFVRVSNTRSELSMTIIPEPAALALAAIGAVLLLGGQRLSRGRCRLEQRANGILSCCPSREPT